MRTRVNPELLAAFVSDLLEALKDRVSLNLKALALTGSYVAGTVSVARPDINVIVGLDRAAAADAYIHIGDALSDIGHRYSDRLSVRPEFRPFRFSYPLVRDKPAVYVNPIILHETEAGGDFPFGLPKNFIAGIREMQNVIYGEDMLAGLDLRIDRQYMVLASFRDLAIFRLQLTRSPLCYDLTSDCELLLNESLVIGKMAMGYGVELACTETELREHKYLEFFRDRQRMVAFLAERYGDDIAACARTIADARESFDDWAQHRDKAEMVFGAAFRLLETFWQRLLRDARAG